MITPESYTGQALSGEWLITRKLDGVRMLRDGDNKPVSRGNKPLYGLDSIPHEITDAEIFCESWEKTIAVVRSKNAEPVSVDCAYSIDPIDPRLIICKLTNPTETEILELMEQRVNAGDEGLVMYQENKAYKVKPSITYDVPVTGFKPGTGINSGIVGSLITPMGNVSAGLSRHQREHFAQLLPEVIEVECMELTSSGKFRHPRFIRERFDKSADQVDFSIKQEAEPAEEKEKSFPLWPVIPALIGAYLVVMGGSSLLSTEFGTAGIYFLLASLSFGLVDYAREKRKEAEQ